MQSEPSSSSHLAAKNISPPSNVSTTSHQNPTTTHITNNKKDHNFETHKSPDSRIRFKSMGLQSQLTDVSTDSIPLLLIATIAGGVSHLRSIFLTFLHFLHLHRIPPTHDLLDHTTLLLGSGLSNLVLLAHQLNMNRIFSHKFGDSCHDRAASDCVVCLCSLKEGDQVRRLPCCHVFHKSCFDGWLDHLNFNCPLCRSPLIEPGCAAEQRRVASDAVAWFGAH